MFLGPSNKKRDVTTPHGVPAEAHRFVAGQIVERVRVEVTGSNARHGTNSSKPTRATGRKL
jgi:hypothetical protein